MTTTRLLGLALLLALTGCSTPLPEPPAGDVPRGPTPAAVKKTLGEPTVAVLEGATKVEVFRIKSNRTDAESQSAAKTIGGYPVTAQGKDQGQAFARKLADVLLDEKTYSKSFAKCYEPGVAFRVWKGEEHVDVVICFMCSNFYCGPPVNQASENASFSGSVNRPRLVQLAKEGLPGDKTIQELSDK